MTTIRSMPCTNPDVRYRNGWMRAMGERWLILKERRGAFRRITRWFLAHDKKLRPNPNKKRDERRWRKMGYD